MENKLQEAITKYHAMGLPIFPVSVVLTKDGKAGKYPLIKEWQKVTEKDFYKMNWAQANAIGMVTGAPSNTLVLDLDLGADISGRELPPTPCQKTGSGGRHIFFKYIAGVKNAVGIEPHVDIRASDGYVVLAPSAHPAGEYEWIIPFELEDLADAPEWLVELLKNSKNIYNSPHNPRLAFGAPSGTRNESATKVIGHILSRIHPNYWLDFGLTGLRAWNQRNTPPLPDEELVAVFKSIAARQMQYAKNK